MARFFISQASSRPSRESGTRGGGALERRRLAHTARRAGLCAAVGLLVWSLLSMALALVPTRQVAVASEGIRRGATIMLAQVTVRTVPDDAAFAGAFDGPAAVAGLVAVADIDAGQPLFPSLAREPPLPAAGRTVVGVPLASTDDGMLPGDTVMLMAAHCVAGTGMDNTGMDDTDVNAADMDTDDTAKADACVVASHATVMRLPDTSTDGGSQWGGPTSGETTATMLSMTPQEALGILALRETTAIVAVPADDG